MKDFKDFVKTNLRDEELDSLLKEARVETKDSIDSSDVLVICVHILEKYHQWLLENNMLRNAD